MLAVFGSIGESRRGGRIEMASWTRPLGSEKFLLQIIFVNRDGRTPISEARGGGDGISASHYRARNVDGRPNSHPYFFVFLSLYRPLISTVLSPLLSSSFAIAFTRENGYVFLGPERLRSLIPPSAERMRRPDITMPPLTRANNDAVKSIPLHSKQDEKYLAWFFVRLLSLP